MPIMAASPELMNVERVCDGHRTHRVNADQLTCVDRVDERVQADDHHALR